MDWRLVLLAAFFALVEVFIIYVIYQRLFKAVLTGKMDVPGGELDGISGTEAGILHSLKVLALIILRRDVLRLERYSPLYVERAKHPFIFWFHVVMSAIFLALCLAIVPFIVWMLLI